MKLITEIGHWDGSSFENTFIDGLIIESTRESLK